MMNKSSFSKAIHDLVQDQWAILLIASSYVAPSWKF